MKDRIFEIAGAVHRRLDHASPSVDFAQTFAEAGAGNPSRGARMSRRPAPWTPKITRSGRPAKKTGPKGPWSYTRERGEEICRRLACGESLAKVCRDKNMPDTDTVRMWVIRDHDGFAQFAA